MLGFRQLPNYQQNCCELMQPGLMRCFGARRTVCCLEPLPAILRVSLVLAPYWGGTQNSVARHRGARRLRQLCWSEAGSKMGWAAQNRRCGCKSGASNRLTAKRILSCQRGFYFKRGSSVETHLAARIAASASALLPSMAGRPPGGFCR